MNRRAFLKGSALVAGAAAVGFSGLFDARRAKAQGEGDDLQTILNLAATAETLACTHYYAALNMGGIEFTEPQVAYMKAALEAELIHLEFLNANGGEALTSEFYTPVNVFTDLALFTEVTEVAESAFIGAYLAATRRAAELGNPLLAMTASQVGGVEAQHLALIRQMGSRLANNLSLMKALFFNVSDAVPTLQPFLAGGDGFEGPTAYPGAEAIRTLIGESLLEVVMPAVAEDAFSTMEGTATP
jgi:hypothetical protein